MFGITAVFLNYIDLIKTSETGATNVEYVYFDGTAVTAVALPIGGILKELRLPSTITNLTVRNQPAITTFYMPSYHQCFV